MLTDRNLVSFYIRYSENLEKVPYSPESKRTEEASSSPLSTASNHDGDISHLSGASNSTTQTTPLRHDVLAMARRVRPNSPFEDFEAVLHGGELSKEVKDEYRRHGRNILHIAYNLFPQMGEAIQEDAANVWELIHATGHWLSAALHGVETEVQNIAYIQTLGPFTVMPTPDDTWAIYKQMVDLVIKWAVSAHQ